MIPQGRPLLALVAVVILLIFFLAGPFTVINTKPVAAKHISNADARLARWIEVVSPPGKPYRPLHAYGSPMHQPVRDQSRPLVMINPYPLGKPESTSDQYLNADKRGKNTPHQSESSSPQVPAPGHTELEAHEAPGAVQGSDSISPPPGVTDAVKHEALKAPIPPKKSSAAGLSPLDKLQVANIPLVSKPVAAQNTAGLSSFGKSAGFNPSEVGQPGHDTASINPQDHMGSNGVIPTVNGAAAVNKPINIEMTGSKAPVAKAGVKIQAPSQANAPVAGSAAKPKVPLTPNLGKPEADSPALNAVPVAGTQGVPKAQIVAKKAATQYQKLAVDPAAAGAMDANLPIALGGAPLAKSADTPKALALAAGQPPTIDSQLLAKAAAVGRR